MNFKENYKLQRIIANCSNKSIVTSNKTDIIKFSYYNANPHIFNYSIGTDKETALALNHIAKIPIQ